MVRMIAIKAILFLVLCSPSSAFASPAIPYAKIPKATIAALIGKDPALMKVREEEKGIFHVTYRRHSDNTLWGQLVRFEGNKVIWAGYEPETRPGRWRPHPDDEVITYSISGQVLTIKESYSDGEAICKTFKLYGL